MSAARDSGDNILTATDISCGTEPYYIKELPPSDAAQSSAETNKPSPGNNHFLSKFFISSIPN